MCFIDFLKKESPGKFASDADPGVLTDGFGEEKAEVAVGVQH